MKRTHASNSPYNRVPNANRATLCLLALALTTSLLSTICSAQVESSISEPLEWSSVAAAEQGVIDEIKVKVGQPVKRGDILARLDTKDLQQSILLAQMKADSQSKIKSAEANLKFRKSQYDNLSGLSKDGHSNPLEVAQSAAQFEQAQAELLLAQEEKQQELQEVERLSALLERRIVRSPIDGVITEVHRRAGEYVSANEPQVANVINLDQLRVRFYLFPEQIEHLELHQSVKIGCASGEVPSTIEFISPITDPKTGLSRVDVLINNLALNSKLRSGSKCRWPSQPTTAEATEQSRQRQSRNGLNPIQEPKLRVDAAQASPNTHR